MSRKPHSRSVRRSRAVAWIPAAMVVTASAMTVAGVSLVPGATAASSVAVTGVVAPSISTNPALSATCTTPADQLLTSFASAFDATNGCTVTFDTNDPDGAEVVFDNQANDAAFLCNDKDGGGIGVRACADGSITDAGATPEAIDANQAGLALTALGGTAPAAGTGVGTIAAFNANTAGVADAADLIWVGIDAGRQLCSTPDPTAGTTCTFMVGARGAGANQAAGTYRGTVDLTAQAL